MNITRHAMTRCRQRGIRDGLLNLIYAEADRLMPCGQGCIALEVSHEKIDEMRPVLGAGVERARNVILVVSDDERLVTVLHGRNAKSARYYRSH